MRDTQREVWEGPTTGASIPMEMGFITLLIHGCVHQPGSSPYPMLLGLYRGFIM